MVSYFFIHEALSSALFKPSSFLKCFHDDWILLHPHHSLLDDSFLDDLAPKFQVLLAGLLSNVLDLLFTVLDIEVQGTVLLLHLLFILRRHALEWLELLQARSGACVEA